MITYAIDPRAHLVTCHVTASLRALDVANIIEQLWRDPEFSDNHDTLVHVDGTTVTPDIIARNALAELLLTWRKLHVPARWAFILPGSAWQRMASQLMDEYELAGRNVRCFRDETGVLSWLQTPRLATVAP